MDHSLKQREFTFIYRLGNVESQPFKTRRLRMLAKIRFIAVILLVAAALAPQFERAEIPSTNADVLVAKVNLKS